MSISSERLLILTGVHLVIYGLMISAGLFTSDPTTQAVAAGLGGVSAAGIMMWASLKVPVKVAFVVIIIALLLPEFSVESFLIWTGAGADSSSQSLLVLASITGSTRLILGIAWPLAIFGYWFRNRVAPITLSNAHGIALPVIFLATLYMFNIYLKGFLSIIDAAVLLAVFAIFVVKNNRRRINAFEGSSKDRFAPPSVEVKTHSLKASGLFILAAASTVVMAGAFYDNLALADIQFGVNQFTLTQWAVPLVSKGPWLALILTMVYRAKAHSTASVLLTSHAGLLAISIGLLPLILYAHGLMHGGDGLLMLDDRQRSELLLTATQSLFAVALLAGIAISWRSGLSLFALFVAHLTFRALQPEGNISLVNGLFSIIYLSSSIALIMGNRTRLQALAGAMTLDISPLRRGGQSASVGDNQVLTKG